MATGIRKLTYEDYVCFPDDGKRHEIIGDVPVELTENTIAMSYLEGGSVNLDAVW